MSDMSGGGRGARGRDKQSGGGRGARGRDKQSAGGTNSARDKQSGGGRSAGAGAERGGGTNSALGRDKQSGDGLNKALGATAAFAAGYGARRLVTFAWKRITGKEPPSDLQDPQVSIGEALSWAVVLGVSMETARLLAGRAATKKMRRDNSGAQ